MDRLSLLDEKISRYEKFGNNWNNSSISNKNLTSTIPSINFSEISDVEESEGYETPREYYARRVPKSSDNIDEVIGIVANGFDCSFS
jgi:hypothetical protein